MVNDPTSVTITVQNEEFCSDVLGVELGENGDDNVTVIEIPAAPEPESMIHKILKSLMAPAEVVRENWKYLSPKRSQAKRRKHARQGR